MFFVDYPRRTRLKVFGRGTVIEDGPQREIEIAVEAFDWNCSRSIIPRFDREYLRELGEAYQAKFDGREAELQAEIDEKLDMIEQSLQGTQDTEHLFAIRWRIVA